MTDKTSENEEKWKEMYLQFQYLQQQIEKISEHAEMLNQQNAELDLSQEAIEEISTTKTDTEILAPVANGIFLKTALQDNQTLLVNVGADTVVEKKVKEVAELLRKQQEEITARITEAEAVLQELHLQAMKIYQEIEKKEG